MRVSASFEQDKEAWVLTALSGEFEGQVVAYSEGLTMEDVTFVGTAIHGRVRASWGIELKDEVTTSLEVLKALGVGQLFKCKGPIRFFMDGTVFCCAESKRVLHVADHVMVMKRGMFYLPIRRK